MPRYFILLCLVFLVIFALFSKDLSFFQEDIVFEISENSIFSVSGDYYFRNNSAKHIKQLLFYPFPLDTLYGKIIQIKIEDTLDSTKNPLIRFNQKGASFLVEIPPKGAKIYHIFYQQKIKSNQAEYILLTTHNWKESFEVVNYQLITPETMDIIFFSYEPDNFGIFNSKKSISGTKRISCPTEILS